MKVLRCVTLGVELDVIRGYFEKEPAVDYNKAIEFLKSQFLLYPNQFDQNMRKKGIESETVLANFLPLQKVWCEQILKEKREQWDIETILEKQIAYHKPDVLYFERSAFSDLPPHFKRHVKQKFPFLKLVGGYWGALADKSVYRELFSGIDFLFTQDAFVYEATGDIVEKRAVVPHCFDLSVRAPEEIRENDFVFIGSSGFGYSHHESRFSDLKFLLKNSAIQMWLSEPNAHLRKEKLRWKLIQLAKPFVKSEKPLSLPLPKKVLAKYNHLIRDAHRLKNNKVAVPWYLKEERLRDAFPSRVKEAIFGTAYIERLSHSKIVLNKHSNGKKSIGNMRCFEATGLGACLLTDGAQEISPLFEPDREVIVYQNAEEAAEKATYLLDHPQTLLAVARKGYEKTLQCHTAAHRCDLIASALQTWIHC